MGKYKFRVHYLTFISHKHKDFRTEEEARQFCKEIDKPIALYEIDGRRIIKVTLEPETECEQVIIR